MGRQNDENVILGKIITSTCNDVLGVLPIVGMGGLGKTTLARKIFHHQDTQNHFNQKIWICVSQNFDQLTLFKRILQLLHEGFHGDSLEAVVQKLQEKLKGKRYLLVLDDMWNEDKTYWEEFSNTLIGVSSNEGNVIIVTTRSTEVALIVNTFKDPYNLRKLSDEDCWSIIKAKALRGRDVLVQFESIGKEIAHRCGGLPLLANMMGGVLTRKGIDVWQSILGEELLNLQVGDKGEMQVIRVSYDRLPNSSMKKCFAYCSLFIKDSVIDKDDLIQRWMAEGFVPNDPTSDMETIGNNIFNMLLQHSFFQEAEEDMYGNIKNCKMHNLHHDLASSISNSEIYTKMDDLTLDIIPPVRRVAAKSIREETHNEIKVKASYLRTLILQGRVPHEILSFFKALYVLKLSGAKIKELPDSIRKLIHLRYLDVSYNDGLKTLPDSICELFNLQTLRILYNKLERLPKDMRSLIHLRHLCFDNVDSDFEMPPEIRKLSCLQTLTLFCVSDKEGCRIDELGGLQNLKGKLKIRNLELVCNKTEAENADIAGKRGIYKLHFHWRNGEDTDATKISINDESILEALQPHANLKKLTIEGFRGKKFPLWTRQMEICEGNGRNMVLFDKMIKIDFKNCRQVEEIPMFGHLPHLKFLRLDGLPRVRCIGLSFYGVNDGNNYGQERRVSFPSLVCLTIGDLENLTEWTEPQNNGGDQVLPRLKIFDLSRCGKLSHVPLLRAVGASLQQLRISDCHELIELHDDLYSLESLETLVIDSCENLQLIHPRQIGQKELSSLQNLSIFFCDNLTSLSVLSGMRSLKRLEVTDCDNLISLPELSGMGSLQHLEVTSCDNLTSLPELSGIGSLQHLELTSCKNLTSFPELSGVGCINSLRELCFGCSSKFMQLSSFKGFLDSIQQMKFVQHLQLSGLDDSVSLPHQFQHLPVLNELTIDSFGMEELPDWLGNLSSLERFNIWSCEKLRYLPSKDAMQRLTKLTSILIYQCSLLEERCKEDSGPDSEWPKISHIPQRYIC